MPVAAVGALEADLRPAVPAALEIRRVRPGGDVDVGSPLRGLHSAPRAPLAPSVRGIRSVGAGPDLDALPVAFVTALDEAPVVGVPEPVLKPAVDLTAVDDVRSAVDGLGEEALTRVVVQDGAMELE
jgi:hypothetical protein